METRIQRDGTYTGMTDIISYRADDNQGLIIAKLIAFGYDCIDLHDTWSTPATYSFTALGQTTTFTGPTYDFHCGASQLIFEFYDQSEVQSGPLNWITIDPSTNDVTMTPTLQEF